MRRRLWLGSDAGMVTAELALALPALVLVVAMLSAVVTGMSSLAKASDAARSAARAASIGVDTDRVIEDAARLAPPRSEIEVSAGQRGDGYWVSVTVSPPPVRLGPLSLGLPEVTGTAPLEPHLSGVGR